MLRFPRPCVPSDFERKTRKARQAVEDKLAVGEKPDFEDKWRSFKRDFSDAQHGKCGYCEAFIRGNEHGDVEHYAPKSVYPRLAYAWDNYLYACQLCNQTHKQEQFPTEPAHQAAGRYGVIDLGPDDVPLLLNPYEQACNPADHLAYDRTGAIHARAGSDRGWHTIEVCGLDRVDMRISRAEDAERAYQLVACLEEAVAGDMNHAMDEVLRDFARMGAVERRFAGMVRAIFEQHWDTAWEDAFPDDTMP